MELWLKKRLLGGLDVNKSLEKIVSVLHNV